MFGTGSFCRVDSVQCYNRIAPSAGNGDEHALFWGESHPSLWTNKPVHLLWSFMAHGLLSLVGTVEVTCIGGY